MTWAFDYEEEKICGFELFGNINKWQKSRLRKPECD